MKLRVEKLSASVFGIGYLPLAPGSWASLVAVLVWYFIQQQIDFIPVLQFVCIITACIIGFWSSNSLENEWGKDPSQIVIDEWAGMWISCFLIPPGWENLLIAFIAFRILDIWKPLFIRKAEKLKGGWGVMMDDILAGIVANILVLFLLWLV